MRHLNDLRVLVLGLGASGTAMARWCLRHGAHVTAWDSRPGLPGLDALQDEHPTLDLLVGPLGPEALAGVQLVLKSPGLPPHDERIEPVLAQARATGVAVQAEWDLFARALEDLKAERGYAPQLLAITGTNGKTTTTQMTAMLVERCGRTVAVAGNVGPTLLDTLTSVIDSPAPPEDVSAPSEPEVAEAGNAPDAAESTAPAGPTLPVGHWPSVWVLELSSFQLQDAARFAADAAVVLNLTQDHLDWHGDMASYAAAKARIFGGTGTRVVNADDPLVMGMLPAPEAPAKGRGRAAAVPAVPVVRFSLAPPRHPGDFGLVTEGGMAWLVRALPADETERRKPGEVVEIHLQRLMPADALRVRGRHNAANALAALALATAIGCPLAPMLHGLREYRGEPHRVEWVGAVGDVDAIDDSKGTNVGATVAALTGLGADRTPAQLVVILGGDGKGQDFAPLRQPLQQHARAVALIGRDASSIEAVVAEAGVPHARHATLPEAVAWAFAQARPGDAVLLSPACASLDMFRNYAHRAEVFVDAVRALALDQGASLT
jgi:UDP-N-acetylmuramoylalanine--D-glutamate ligase